MAQDGGERESGRVVRWCENETAADDGVSDEEIDFSAVVKCGRRQAVRSERTPSVKTNK